MLHRHYPGQCTQIRSALVFRPITGRTEVLALAEPTSVRIIDRTRGSVSPTGENPTLSSSRPRSPYQPPPYRTLVAAGVYAKGTATEAGPDGSLTLRVRTGGRERIIYAHVRIVYDGPVRFVSRTCRTQRMAIRLRQRSVVFMFSPVHLKVLRGQR